MKFYTKGTQDSYLGPVSCQAQFLRCEDSLRGKLFTAVVGGPVVAPGLYPHWAQELLVGAVEKYLRQTYVICLNSGSSVSVRLARECLLPFINRLLGDGSASFFKPLQKGLRAESTALSD